MSDAESRSGAASITVKRRIEWMDTDAAGIYHWTTVFRLAESAEAALHTALGVEQITFGATPRVSVQADFRSPLKFNDVVEARLTVARLGRTSVTYAIEVSGPDGLAAEGQVTTCFIDVKTGRAVSWPDEVREALTGFGVQTEA